jgi:hypothetical protein
MLHSHPSPPLTLWREWTMYWKLCIHNSNKSFYDFRHLKLFVLSVYCLSTLSIMLGHYFVINWTHFFWYQSVPTDNSGLIRHSLLHILADDLPARKDHVASVWCSVLAVVSDRIGFLSPSSEPQSYRRWHDTDSGTVWDISIAEMQGL